MNTATIFTPTVQWAVVQQQQAKSWMIWWFMQEVQSYSPLLSCYHLDSSPKGVVFVRVSGWLGTLDPALCHINRNVYHRSHRACKKRN